MASDQQTPEPEPQPNGSNEALKENVKSGSTWMRLLFMIVVAFLYSVSRIVVGAVVVFQFFWVLFTGEKNAKLLTLGQSLSTYTYQAVGYLTFTTEERPFPFDADWPTGPPLT
jgi:hypothetical protein